MGMVKKKKWDIPNWYDMIYMNTPIGIGYEVRVRGIYREKKKKGKEK